jgi:hypothetical protein
MLARVSSALMKFISPIANSIGVDDQSDRHKGQGFERYKKDEKAKDKEGSPTDIEQNARPKLSLVSSSANKEEGEFTPAFVQLFTLIQKTKARMTKFRCSMLYDFNLRNRKKKKVKGAMLDTSV